MKYWWHLVNVKNSELILHKFYLAQKWNRSKGDWINQLEQQKKDLKLDSSDTDIGCYSKDQFSRIVKRKTEEFASR